MQTERRRRAENADEKQNKQAAAFVSPHRMRRTEKPRGEDRERNEGEQGASCSIFKKSIHPCHSNDATTE